MGEVAIVGMAGRFPGAEDVDALWRLLVDGRDAIGQVPADRWEPDEVAEYARAIPSVGGFLEGIDGFDAAFFGVSPREACVLDPQQRLMLETSWRALEDAGQRACDIRGSRVGVYFGGLWHDHELLRKERGQPPTQHSIVGNSLDIVAARVSYFLGLTGPSLTVESSCSSSLVAVHLACQALRSGDIDAAIVGGSNLMLSPDVTVGLTHFGGLSPSGRCRPFGAGADGFVRGEGVVAVYLKPLDRAVRDGDAVRAVIVASAVNNDGGGDSLVTPNTDAQQDLLRQVYGPDGIPGHTLGYVEAHGTGTARGDASEATAIGRVLGGLAGRPLPIGSIKSNIGHLEPASGLAGLVKAVLSLEHGVVPPSLNADELNPDIDFAELGLDVVRAPLELPADDDLHIGVNSFGWGGTNAHVVLARPTARRVNEPEAHSGAFLLPVSAHNQSALRARADGVLAMLAAGASGPDLAQALSWHRDHFPEREAIVVDGDDRTSLTGRGREVGKVAFVFPGQGAQWQAMGAHLYGSHPVFTETVDRCGQALSEVVNWDLRELLTGRLGPGWLSRVDMVQPALWAMSVSLAAAWQDAGVCPGVLIGHSQGEIAAATVAGALSMQDAALVVGRRSELLREVADKGRMLAVDLDRDAALAALSGFEDTVGLAVHNGPRSCVLSGETDAVLLLKEILEAGDVFCRLVEVDYASHSPQIDPLLPRIQAALTAVRPRRGVVPLVSTVTLDTLDGSEMNAAYWSQNLRRQVRFADAVDKAAADGVTHFIEISPHPGLTAALGQLAGQVADPPAVLSTLRRGEGAPSDLLRAFGRAYVSGLSPWGRRPASRPSATPPPYPWQREQYRMPRQARAARPGRLELPLAPSPSGPMWLALGRVGLDTQPWLADHKVVDSCVFPAGGYLALIQQSLGALSDGRPVTLHDVALPAALPLDGRSVGLSATWLAAGDCAGIATISSMPESASNWTQNCRVLAHWADEPSRVAHVFPGYLLDAPSVAADDFYVSCAQRGLHYGPAFRPVQRVHATDADALVLIRPPRAGGRTATWDAILQAALALEPKAGTVLPTSIGSAWLAAVDDDELWVHARRVGAHGYDLAVFDRRRAPVGTVEGLVMTSLAGADRGWTSENVYRMRYEECDALPPEPRAGLAVVVCGPSADEVKVVAEMLPDATPVVLDGAEDIPDCDGLVFVAPTGLTAQRDGLVTLARLVGDCLSKLPAATITVLTRAAQQAPDGSAVDPGAALYSGLTYVLQAEHPQFRARLVDVDPDAVPPGLAAELVACDGPDVVVLRGARRWVGRRVRGGPAGDSPRAWRTGARQQPFRVTARLPGRLDSLGRQPLERRPPGPGEVEVAVQATSLNFIDVMKAMGVYPDTSPGADRLGLDCAGTITAVGEQVNGRAVGDPVVACGFGMLATHATVDARHVATVPDGLTPEQAAALPMAMATAWHALVDVARVRAGETVLIHSATGGVGLAAIAVARLAGATVLATAGTEDKRSYLRRLGIADVFDSRGLDWCAGVRAATGGRGVDVVLNSLAGAAIPLGLESLAEDGRFVELGKRDIYADATVALGAFRKAVSLSAVDIAGMMRRTPARFAELLDTVMGQVASRGLQPLPVLARCFADVEGTFRTMSAGEHIGKIVLNRPQDCDVGPDPRVRAQATYLITGGMGALGICLAEDLADSGAGAIALTGRSDPTNEVAARIEALRARGVTVRVYVADVADEARMSAVLDEIRAQLPALHGVFHAAGVLDDATLPNLDADRLERVLAAKVDGARLLDRLTADDPLDMFVLFSSAAAFVGTVGQGGYAAANAYLDALAVRRRQSGRAGLSVQWGPVSDVGLAAARADRGDRLADRGLRGVSVQECWEALRHFLDGGEVVVAYAALDPQRWIQTYPALAALPSWRPIVESATGDGTVSVGVADRLRELPAAVRRGLVEQRVRSDAAAVLMVDLDTLVRDHDLPLKSLGLDSLMAIELRNRLESSLGLRLSPTLLWKHSSLSRLSAALSALVDEQQPAAG